MKKNSLVGYLITLLAAFGLWHVASLWLGSNFLPGPLPVFSRIILESGQRIFWEHIGASGWRIGAGLLGAFVTAVPLGLALGSSRRLDRLFAPLVYLSYPIPKIVLMPIILL